MSSFGEENSQLMNSFLSVAVKGWRLASQAFANDNKKYRKKQQWKSFFWALITPRFAAKWFKLLETPDFISIVPYRKGLYFKPFRVYMSIAWNREQRVKTILDSYRFARLKGDAFMKVITQTSGYEIARFKMSDTVDGFITLGYEHHYRKEGELVFFFKTSEGGGMISSAAVSFEEVDGKWVCRIGCVMGHKVNNESDENSSKAAQKLMNGLRPKSLIIYAVQEFSRQMGITAVYGAGDSIQVYRKKHAINLPWQKSIQFDYNAVWVESSGQPAAEGWYELPLIPVRKSVEEIKTHKRAVYRRRYAMLDEVSLKIAETVKKF